MTATVPGAVTLPPRLRSALSAVPASHLAAVYGFVDELQRVDPDGAHLRKIADASELGRAAADRLVDATSLWVEHLGAFYDVGGVAELLGRDGHRVTKQAVSKRKGLLALTTGSGQVVYPAFQFRDRQPAPGLGEVLGLLPEQLVSRWTVASWLASPEADLNGERPIDVLHDGGDGDRRAVQAAARRWAAALAA